MNAKIEFRKNRTFIEVISISAIFVRGRVRKVKTLGYYIQVAMGLA